MPIKNVTSTMITRGTQNNSFSLKQRTHPRAAAGVLGADRQSAPFDFSELSRSQRREVQRRSHLLNRVAALKAAGLSEARAARKVGLSVQSLWRWRTRRIVPNTHLCGVRSTLEKLQVPQIVLRRVRALQLAGRTPAAAWREIAKDRTCPPHIADYLRTARTLPPSLIKATRAPRRELVILEVRVYRRVNH